MGESDAHSGYTSMDGANWAPLLRTTQTIRIGQNVFAGLAVTSGSNTALATATFENGVGHPALGDVGHASAEQGTLVSAEVEG